MPTRTAVMAGSTYAHLLNARRLLERAMRPGDRGVVKSDDVIVEVWQRLGHDPPFLVSSSSDAPKPPAVSTLRDDDDAARDRFALLELDALPATSAQPTEPVQGLAGEVTTTTTTGRASPVTESTTEQLQPQVFREEPAIVRVSLGRTVNLGNYESTKVEVSISMPCAPVNAAATYTRVRDDVQARLAELVEQARRRLS